MNQQPNYGQQPMYQQPQEPLAPIVSVKEWLMMYLIMCVPIVNIIVMFMWAFGGNVNPSKANYMKSALIMAAIVIVLEIVFFILFGAAILSMAGMSGAAGY